MTISNPLSHQDVDTYYHKYPYEFMCGALSAFFMDLVTSMVYLERKGWFFEPWNVLPKALRKIHISQNHLMGLESSIIGE